MNAIAGGRPSKSGTAASGSGLSANARGSTNPNGSKDNTLTGQGRNAGGKNKDGNKGLQSANSQGSSSSGGISSSALGSSSLGNQHNSSNRLTIEINSLNFPPLAGTGDKGTASHAVEDSTKTVLDDMITKVISGTTPPSSSDETVTHTTINTHSRGVSHNYQYSLINIPLNMRYFTSQYLLSHLSIFSNPLLRAVTTTTTTAKWGEVTTPPRLFTTRPIQGVCQPALPLTPTPSVLTTRHQDKG